MNERPVSLWAALRIPKAAVIALAALALAAVFFVAKAVTVQFYRAAYPRGYREIVERYAAERDLPVFFVFAVICTESSFRPRAVSDAQARGLMQITRVAFDWAKGRMKDETTVYDDLFDPEVNIRYGTYILSLLTEEFQNTGAVLSAYHAGWGSVKQWLADPRYSSDGATLDAIPFGDTEWYVRQVEKTRRMYERLYIE